MFTSRRADDRQRSPPLVPFFRFCGDHRAGDDPVCAGCDLATQDEVNDCVRDTPTDWIGVDDCASQNRLMCCYNQVTGLDCSGNDRWYFEFRCGRNSCSEDNRVCDGGTADETSPAPTTTTPAPTIATLAPSAANAPVTTTTPAPGAASSPTDYASSTDCVSDAGQTCSECFLACTDDPCTLPFRSDCC